MSSFCTTDISGQLYSWGSCISISFLQYHCVNLRIVCRWPAARLLVLHHHHQPPLLQRPALLNVLSGSRVLPSPRNFSKMHFDMYLLAIHLQVACGSTSSFCTTNISGQLYAWGKLKVSGDNIMCACPSIDSLKLRIATKMDRSLPLPQVVRCTPPTTATCGLIIPTTCRVFSLWTRTAVMAVCLCTARRMRKLRAMFGFHCRLAPILYYHESITWTIKHLVVCCRYTRVFDGLMGWTIKSIAMRHCARQ